MQQGRLWREYRDGLTHQQAEGDGHEGGVPAEQVRPRHRRVQHEGRHRPRDQVEHHPDVRQRLIGRFSLPSVQESNASLLSVAGFWRQWQSFTGDCHQSQLLAAGGGRDRGSGRATTWPPAPAQLTVAPATSGGGR